MAAQSSSTSSSSSSCCTATTTTTGSPCAACKFLRRKCIPGCVFAPYFPPEDPQKFANVHKVFGASNVTKLLNELLPQQREDAVSSLAYEAEARVKDPVYGCVGAISVLQRQVHRLQKELEAANADLIRYASGELVAPAGVLAMAATLQVSGGGGGGGAGPVYYQHHHHQGGGGGAGGGGGGVLAAITYPLWNGSITTTTNTTTTTTTTTAAGGGDHQLDLHNYQIRN